LGNGGVRAVISASVEGGGGLGTRDGGDGSSERPERGRPESRPGPVDMKVGANVGDEGGRGVAVLDSDLRDPGLCFSVPCACFDDDEEPPKGIRRMEAILFDREEDGEVLVEDEGCLSLSERDSKGWASGGGVIVCVGEVTGDGDGERGLRNERECLNRRKSGIDCAFEIVGDGGEDIVHLNLQVHP
jgi:hypothetical protein